MDFLKKININTSFKEKVKYLVYLFLGFQLLSIIGDNFVLVSQFFFLVFIALTIWLTWKKLEFGLLILVFEFLAGHGGHLFEFMGLSIRSTIFMVVLIVWFIKKIKTKDFNFSRFFQSPILITYLLFLILIFVGFLNGVISGNGILALKDVINYSFFLLVLPLLDVVSKGKFLKNLFLVIIAGIIGITIETFIVFLLFAFSLSQVHDVFYWWWRDLAIGKATFTKDNFFRIVSPAHLFVLPVFITFLSLIIAKFKKGFQKKYLIILALLLSFCLLLNFSRAYFLGVLIGLIVLKVGTRFKKWLLFSVIVILLMVVQFGVLFGIASGGDVLEGAGFLKNRMETLTKPQDELSSLTRLVILPDLLSQIYDVPIFGHGLGSKVGYPDPLSGEYKHTFHIDWGYLEIWLELGFLALILYFTLLTMIFCKAYKIAKRSVSLFKKRLYFGIGAGLVALFVASLAGPFLFHPLGILYIVLSLIFVVNA